MDSSERHDKSRPGVLQNCKENTTSAYGRRRDALWAKVLAWRDMPDERAQKKRNEKE
jgi:hypothetical protein